jgi:3-phenylpropionate/trans-cinnamate dioxygenase ferredoxin component
MPEVRVCSVEDVKPDSALRVDAGGHRIALVRIGESDWYALGDRCSHGEVWPDECEIECPKHGSAFSLKTGDPMTLPATQPVPVYRVRVEGDDVMVSV